MQAWWAALRAAGVFHSSLLARRNISTSSARHDVRKVIEGRFSRPEQNVGGIAGAEEAMPPHLQALAPEVNVSPGRRRVAAFFRLFLPISATGCLVYAFTHPDDEPLIPKKMPPELQYMASQQQESQEVLSNWSGTHEVKPKRYFQPESEAEVEAFLRQATKAGQKLRVVGSGLSPNGLGFSEEGMLSMALMDKVLKVDTDKRQVTVQAGCRVQQLVEALAPHGLTLQNFASIREQQIGGFIQVGAHGTGAQIPSVEEQVVSMRLVTPALGTLTLSQDKEPELFNLAKVGLGALGVVSQVTLQCVPRHRLVERTVTTNLADVKKNHATWLRENTHLRYMWIPYTDTVVVVKGNPESSALGQEALAASKQQGSDLDEAQKLAPMRDLLASKVAPGTNLSALSHTQLRDELLALGPTDKDWVARVNAAEAEVWQRSQGVRSGWSDEILGFDCGGQQWVHEAAFPVGQLAELKGTTRDIQYMEALLKEIKSSKVAAAAPIEQRWSASSSAPMSPSSGPPGGVHSWVGVIMYLPEDPALRDQVTQSFKAYARMVQDKLGPRFNAATHWAKLEPPEDSESNEAKQLRARLAARYPLDKFNAYRDVLDPKNVLANSWLDKLMPASK